MTDERLENILQDSLLKINPNKNVNHQILEKAEAKKHIGFRVRKAVILACACCSILGSITVGAVGLTYYYGKHSRAVYFNNYNEAEKAEDKAGFEIRAKERFGCGYSFGGMEVYDSTLYAKQEGKVEEVYEKYKGIYIYYDRKNMVLLLDARQAFEGECIESNDINMRNIFGIDVKYEAYTHEISDTAKFEIIEKTSNKVTIPDKLDYREAEWIQDGIHYSLIGLQEYVSEKELLEIAEELITLE